MPIRTIGFRVIRVSLMAEKMIKQTLLCAAACWFGLGIPLPVQAALSQEVIDCKHLEPAQFQELPDEQKIRCGGEEKTAEEIRREWQDKREHGQAEAEQGRAEAQAQLQEIQKEYIPEIPLEEAEAKMRVELAKLKKQQDADAEARKGELNEIRHDVARLEQQMQSARDSKEKAQIEARAEELGEQLHKKGSGGDNYKYLFSKICQLIDCKMLQWLPHIENVLLLSIISPDGPIIISGRDFGTVKGTLWLKGTFGSRQMIIDTWGDGGIGAIFPSATTIGTVSDLNLTLQVETSQGFTSNDYPLQWVQEVKLLDTSSVSLHNCGKDGNVNSCNWQLNEGESCVSASNMASMILASKPPDPNCPCSAVGFHGNCWAAVGDDFGSDVYQIGPLKNAWQFLTFTFGDSLPKDGSCDDAVPPLGFQSGGNSWNPEIFWCVTPNDELLYWLWVYMVGPKGFPHK